MKDFGYDVSDYRGVDPFVWHTGRPGSGHIGLPCARPQGADRPGTQSYLGSAPPGFSKVESVGKILSQTGTSGLTQARR